VELSVRSGLTCGAAGKRESRCIGLGVPLQAAYVHSLSVGASRRDCSSSSSALGASAHSGEREDISRGLASGSSIRDIAKGLERAASTVSREVARHGGRPEYEPMTQISEPGTRPCGPSGAFFHSCEVAEDGCE